MKSNERLNQSVEKRLKYIKEFIPKIFFFILLINLVITYKLINDNGIKDVYIIKFIVLSISSFILSIFSYFIIKKFQEIGHYLSFISLFIVCSIPCFLMPNNIILSMLPMIIMFLFLVLENTKILNCCYIFNILLIFYYHINSKDFIMSLICFLLVTIIFIISKKLYMILKNEVDFVNKMYDEQRILEKKLEIEPLTKLFNKSAMYKDLNEVLNKCHKNKLNSYVAMIDLDYFKDVNDNYGHINGDKALITLSKTITKNLEKNMTAYRFGGEEFVILFENKSLDEVYKIIEKIRIDFGNIKHKYLKNEKITLSAGISCYNIKDNSSIWLEKADKALYQAKEEGRNKTVIYEEEK